MEDTYSFSEFNISPTILRAIKDMGFEEPTPIQIRAIPTILSGRDVTGQAQTGTGKTAAFGIPAIETIDADMDATQVIVLSPTRELAIQTAEEFGRLAHYEKKMHVVPVYGGQPIERQFKALRFGAHIVVGTPGRVLDHINRGTLRLDDIKMIVLDEADQMLDMGFRDDIETIIRETPKDRQTILFSATLPKPILEISKKFQTNPEMVKVPHKTLTVPQIEQQYIELRNSDKLEILSRLLDIYNPNLALIFCNTKRAVDTLTSQAQARGYCAEGLHGDMKQVQRDRVMNKFRKGTIDVLIATDVAARGIDVDDVELVINYDVPQDVEYYVHRIGRTARAGREGRAITFVGPKEFYKLKTIQKYAKIHIARIPIPTADDVEEMRMRTLTEEVRETIKEGGLDKYANLLERMMMDDYTSLEIAAALLKREIEAGSDPEPVSEEFEKRDRGIEPGMTRLYLNFGKDQRIRPKDVVGAIAGETGINGKDIGSISIYGSYSYVEIPDDLAKMVVEEMTGKSIGGVPLTNGNTIGFSAPKRGGYKNSRK
uniref:DEAD/DEAH box helicase n=1 Tax=Methanovulcanius yangii TaxID=1789227 RepID=UPI0029C9BE32|nr:DEAD/DEAH box helicase [Methanovulcanius yangii]